MFFFREMFKFWVLIQVQFLLEYNKFPVLSFILHMWCSFLWILMFLDI